MEESALQTFHFGLPWVLLLLLGLPVLAWLLGKKGRRSAVVFSSTQLLAEVARETQVRPRRYLWLLRLLGVALLIVALAQPRVNKALEPEEMEGVDIMLVLDFSLSMDAQDFFYKGERVARIDALQGVVAEFLDKRPNDRVGLIGFARDPYLISPLTIDKTWVTEAMRDLKLEGGTAIGSGIVSAVEILKQSDTETKIQIVVSDGFSNTGVNPLEAADLAADEGIRVYPIEILDYRRIQTKNVEKHLFSQIADKTGGQFFQATDTESLRGIYQQIDRLEKNLLQENRYRRYHELYVWFTAAALALLLLEYLLRKTLWNRLP